MPPRYPNIYRLFILFAFWITPFSVQANLQLSELIPDPAGDDTGEWIELYNAGSEALTTTGWKIIVKTRTTSLPTKTIAPQSYLIFTKAESKFTLTNTGANVSLIDPTGSVVSQVTYGKAAMGQSFAWINNAWAWTQSPSPNAPNKSNSQTITPAISVASKSASTITNTYKTIGAEEIAALKSGTKVTVNGVITATPEQVGTHTAFISGLQLNLTAGVWPDLAMGDEVIIKGTVSHTKSYGNRLTVHSPADITVGDQAETITPEELTVGDIIEEHEGKLIKTIGVVSAKSSSGFTLTSAGAEIKVTLRNRDLNWPKLTDEELEITGLVTLNNGELRLWPRSPEDMRVINQPAGKNSAQVIDLTKKSPTDWRGYIVLFFLGIILLAGWFWEKRKLPTIRQLANNFISKLKPK